MRTFKPAVLLMILTLSIAPSYATAALVWDFEVVGTEFSGLGHFEVDAASSDAVGSSLTNFSFSGQVFNHQYTISSALGVDASWSINESNWTIEELNIETSVATTQSPGVFSDYTIIVIDPPNQPVLVSGCFDSLPFGRCGLNLTEADGTATAITFTPTEVPTPVPAPSAGLLMASGLLGLVGYRWQQRRREGTQTA